MGERRAKAERRETATYREITLPVGSATVETTDGQHFIVRERGSAHGDRFADWHAQIECTRTPYLTRADIPPDNNHDYKMLVLSADSPRLIVFVNVATATRADMPGVTARRVWNNDHFQEQLVGVFPTKDDLLRAYVGLELLQLVGEKNGGHPKGQANVAPEVFDRGVAEMTKLSLLGCSYRTIGERLGYDKNTVKRWLMWSKGENS